jgi:hypothetical protein
MFASAQVRLKSRVMSNAAGEQAQIVSPICAIAGVASIATTPTESQDQSVLKPRLD